MATADSSDATVRTDRHPKRAKTCKIDFSFICFAFRSAAEKNVSSSIQLNFVLRRFCIWSALFQFAWYVLSQNTQHSLHFASIDIVLQLKLR